MSKSKVKFQSNMELAFNAGREYHDPGHRTPMLRWRDYDSWINRMETHTHYGKEYQKKARHYQQ